MKLWSFSWHVQCLALCVLDVLGGKHSALWVLHVCVALYVFAADEVVHFPCG